MIETVPAGIPKSQRVQDEIVASGPAQQIDLGHAPLKGRSMAPVSLVEFSDFECPFCAQAALLFSNCWPLIPRRCASRSSITRCPCTRSRCWHEAALAADDQGKFWEMHDALFVGEDKLIRDDLIAKAKQLGLDVACFTKDLDSHRVKPLVDVDRQEGNRLGVDRTPFFFINGHAISGAVDFVTIKQLIDAALKEAARPPAKPVPAQ